MIPTPDFDALDMRIYGNESARDAAAAGADLVYFVQPARGGNIKIGTTRRALKRRLAELQTGSPVPLRCVGTIPGGPDVERAVHDAFARYHLYGEWYYPAPALVAFIARRAAGAEAIPAR